MTLEQFPETRRVILSAIKHGNFSTIGALAEHLGISKEGIRQHTEQLEKNGWIRRNIEKSFSPKGGRPNARFRLTDAGEELFPKAYDALALELIDTAVQEFGIESLRKVLSSFTEARVREWAPRLEGLSLPEKISALRAVYAENDPFVEVLPAEGGFLLVEKNCPFYGIAMKRPALCSLTVTLLMRLLGVKVQREQKFQDGDGRCVFHIFEHRPVQITGFPFEGETANA